MSDHNDELHYPNLTGCRVSLTVGSAVGSKPPVHLPSNVLVDYDNAKSKETIYDFALGTYTIMIMIMMMMILLWRVCCYTILVADELSFLSNCIIHSTIIF
jgi:hypothetical protein